MDDKNREDILLIEKFKSGDRTAFDTLYSRYKKAIYRYLCRMVHNRTLAEEIMQDTFINVYKFSHTFDTKKKFSSWLYSIARNRAKNQFRWMSKRKAVSLEVNISREGDLKLKDIIRDESHDTERAINNNEIKEVIEATMMKMPFDLREALVLCVQEGMSYEEAAKTLNISKSSVASKVFRARKLFAKLVEKEEL